MALCPGRCWCEHLAGGSGPQAHVACAGAEPPGPQGGDWRGAGPSSFACGFRM